MRPLATFEEVDSFLAEACALATTGGPGLGALLGSVTARVAMDLPTDPRSPEYREAQMALYERIAGKPYALSNEAHTFDVEQMLSAPYPYNTRSAAEVGPQLIAAGFIIQTLALPAGATILEMGPGWGTLTLPFAQTGYNVTAVDIEPRYVELLKRRGEMNRVEINAQQGDFFSIAEIDETFDVVLFHSSFHHCEDHLRLLDIVAQKLKPGGRLVLAGEAISKELPYPWGINPDGQGLFSVRWFGWYELTFREDYLLETLALRGWTVSVSECPLTSAGTCYICTRT